MGGVTIHDYGQRLIHDANMIHFTGLPCIAQLREVVYHLHYIASY